MIDAADVLHDYLAAQASLTAVTGTRIWAQRNTPLPGYLPSQGGALVYRSRGGGVNYAGVLLRTSWQMKCYGADVYGADAVYRALFDVLHEAQGSGLRWAQLEIAGQPLDDPQTGWPYVLCFYETWMRVQPA